MRLLDAAYLLNFTYIPQIAHAMGTGGLAAVASVPISGRLANLLQVFSPSSPLAWPLAALIVIAALLAFFAWRIIRTDEKHEARVMQTPRHTTQTPPLARLLHALQRETPTQVAPIPGGSPHVMQARARMRASWRRRRHARTRARLHTRWYALVAAPHLRHDLPAA